MIAPGTIIGDKYEIVSTLGAGGFGNVYRALHMQFGRVVAIKVLKTTLLDESDGFLRLEREAKSLNAIKHKNIVSLYGHGIWQNTPYMVMEFVAGKSLDDILHMRKQLAPEEVVALMAQIFAGLSCAHASGVVHRDLKPSNIMLIPTDDLTSSVKIIDFGLAKLMPGYGIGSQKLTETGYALGTCHYMAPEQCLGGTIDHRADIYSAGCIFYQCLTGKLPFDADDNVAVMFRHINEQPLPIAGQAANKPLLKALQVVLDNCLSKNPDDRYSTADEARADIQQISDGNLTSVTRFSAPYVSPVSKRTTQQDLRGVSIIALAAVGLLGLFMLVGKWPLVPSSSRDSSELAIELFRKWNYKVANPSSLAPELEALVKTDALDHRLTPERRLKVAQWLAHIYEGSQDKKKQDRQIEKTLAIRAAIPSRLRIPSDELLFANTLNNQDHDDLAVAVLRDLQQQPNEHPSAVWEQERSWILLAEILISHGHLDIAEKILKEQLVSGARTESQVHYRILLGDIKVLQKDYDDADKIYLDAIEIPFPYAGASFATMARLAIYKNQNDRAMRYLNNSRPLCKEEFPEKPCETITLLQAIVDARNHNYEGAKKVISSFIQAKQNYCGFTYHFRNSDRELCVAALEAAGYDDLVKMLGPYVRPNHLPDKPLSPMTLRSLIAK